MTADHSENHGALRVAIISDAAPDRNGVGAYHRDLVEQLAPRVERAELLCAEGSPEPVPRWFSIPLPGDSTQRLGIPSPSSLKERIDSLAPHTLVVATPGVYGLLGARYALRRGARLVYAMHTHYENLTRLYWRGLMRPVNEAYLRRANRFLLQRADCVAAVSEEMRELAARDARSEIRLVGTLLNPAFIETPPQTRGDRVQRVAFVGRLAAEKRIGTVIEAAKALPDLQFVIAGEGPLREEVEAAATRLPNFAYRGWVARDAVPGLLDSVDLLVLPSEVEAFGTVALEALAREVAPLVSAGSGIRDWQPLARALYTIGSDESLADAIRRIAALDPALRARKRQLGREAARAMSEDTLRQWLHLLAPGDRRRSRREESSS